MKIKPNVKVVTSIITYIIFISLSIYFYYIGYLNKYAIYLTLGLLFILIKDILIFFIDISEVSEVRNSIKKLKKHYIEGKLSFGDYYLFLNRNYFFPFVLVLYLFFILAYQIDFIYLGDSLYELINSNLLCITIVSGVMTTFREDIDKQYQRKVKSIEGLYKNILINSILSLIGAYIILIQTDGLGGLSYVISLVAGLLIFLVGVSILEEEEELQPLSLNKRGRIKN